MSKLAITGTIEAAPRAQGAVSPARMFSGRLRKISQSISYARYFDPLSCYWSGCADWAEHGDYNF